MRLITTSGMTRLLKLFSTHGAITLSLDAKQEFVAELMERKIAFQARWIEEEADLWGIEKT